MQQKGGIITAINGPVVEAKGMTGFQMREMVMVGKRKLIGEIIILEGDFATIQVYEETSGLRVGEEIVSTGRPLSLKLGPGIIGNIFDGIERPLVRINEMSYGYIPEGIGLISIDENKEWDVKFTAKVGDYLKSGDVYAQIQETPVVLHKVMVPPNVEGKVIEKIYKGSTLIYTKP